MGGWNLFCRRCSESSAWQYVDSVCVCVCVSVYLCEIIFRPLICPNSRDVKRSIECSRNFWMMTMMMMMMMMMMTMMMMKMLMMYRVDPQCHLWAEISRPNLHPVTLQSVQTSLSSNAAFSYEECSVAQRPFVMMTTMMLMMTMMIMKIWRKRMTVNYLFINF